MDIRLLSEQELPFAVDLSRYTFEYCLQRSIMQQDLITGFYQYVSLENLYQLMQSRRICIWGAWLNGQLVGVSAMQAEGHITMLYIAPFFQRRGIGKALLKEMRKFAADVLSCQVVTINAMPAWTGSYFQRQGFSLIQMQPIGAPYVSLLAPVIKEVSYPIKPMKPGIVAAVIGGFVFLILLIAFGFMLICY